MNNFLQNSVFFGVFISIITYEIGVLIKKKLKIAIFNPLLISMALMIMTHTKVGRNTFRIS